MKSLVYEGNHTLALKNKAVPEINKGEALIKVAFTGICGTDLLIWHDKHIRVKPPVILGHEFSGVIEQVGNTESHYKPGDRVVVEPLITCGVCSGCISGDYNLCASLKLIGIDTDGGMAKYVKSGEQRIFRIPDSVSMEDAAFVEPLAVAVHMVGKADLKQGQTVLVTGGGPIGLITAHVAKLRGAEVYVSEINPYRINKAIELGFNVITREDHAGDKIRLLTNGKGADVAFEATGTQFGMNDCIDAAGIKGRVVIAGLPKALPTVDMNQVIAKELSIVGSRVYKSDDFEFALHLIESGQIHPQKYISKIISLNDVIEHGFEAIDRGDPVVKILVNLDNEDQQL